MKHHNAEGNAGIRDTQTTEETEKNTSNSRHKGIFFSWVQSSGNELRIIILREKNRHGKNSHHLYLHSASQKIKRL